MGPPQSIEWSEQSKFSPNTKQTSSETLPSNQVMRAAKNPMCGSHPISELQERCTKLGWPLPRYELVLTEGPPHLKKFRFQVKLGKRTFCDQDALAGTKQKAKANAAKYALDTI